MIDGLLDEVTSVGVELREHTFSTDKLKGLYIDKVITLNKSVINTTAEATCVIAEELGHHYTSEGNILDQRDTQNRKQEKRARNWAYERLIALLGFVQAFENGARNKFEIAEYLGVTENFLEESLQYYQEKYGEFAILGNYMIYFDPLGIGKMFDDI